MAEPAVQYRVTIKPQFLNDHRINFVNITRFTHLGQDIILDLGTFDEQQFLEAVAAKAANATIDAFITHRFGMGLQTLVKLKENIDDILHKLIEGGIISPEPEPEVTQTEEKER